MHGWHCIAVAVVVDCEDDGGLLLAHRKARTLERLSWTSTHWSYASWASLARSRARRAGGMSSRACESIRMKPSLICWLGQLPSVCAARSAPQLTHTSEMVTIP